MLDVAPYQPYTEQSTGRVGKAEMVHGMAQTYIGVMQGH